MAHKTLINGTGYGIKGGRTLIGGTGYKIKKGRTLIGGTGYDISFGVPIGELAVGSIVKLSENGTLAEYLVVNQGIPSSSSLYDSSCNGTWLLRVQSYISMAWSSSQYKPSYSDSLIHTYLNGSFLSLFDANTQEQIKTVKIPYGTDGYGAVKSGSNGLSTRIFMLGGYEIGGSGRGDGRYYFPVDGAKLDYFLPGTSTAANKLRIAKLNGSANRWWLRSPYNWSANGCAWCIMNTGSYSSENYTNYQNIEYAVPVRPAMVMDAESLVTEDDDGSYVLAG